jgi:uncharacterized protein YbjT (DUF2867 family)
MAAVLVTGATGTLGRPTVTRLRANGHDVRSLSRRTGPGLITGDLLTGAGIAEALAGVDAVLHLATSPRKDVAATETLLAAARKAATPHLVVISIVGVDQIPLGYYRGKVEIERLTVESGVPHTILRATQFHSLVAGVFAASRRLPVVVAPALSMQPIAPDEVAQRLVELTETGPSGRVPDIGGPQQRPVRELAQSWRAAVGSRRPIMPLRLPGKVYAALAAGHGMVPGPGYGRATFEDYLAERYPIVDRTSSS